MRLLLLLLLLFPCLCYCVFVCFFVFYVCLLLLLHCEIKSVSIVRRFNNPTVSRFNFKAQPLKLRLALTLSLTLTDTGGAVLTLMLGYRKFKETNTALTQTLTLSDTGDLRTIEPSDYRAATGKYTQPLQSRAAPPF